MPFHGCRFPTNRCGNFMGRMTASFNASFACSKPATSSHLMSGLSVNIAPARAPRSFFASGSPSSSSSSLWRLRISLLVYTRIEVASHIVFHPLTSPFHHFQTPCRYSPPPLVSSYYSCPLPLNASSASPPSPCTLQPSL